MAPGDRLGRGRHSADRLVGDGHGVALELLTGLERLRLVLQLLDEVAELPDEVELALLLRPAPLERLDR